MPTLSFENQMFEFYFEKYRIGEIMQRNYFLGKVYVLDHCHSLKGMFSCSIISNRLCWYYTCDIQIFSRHALPTREVLKWYCDIEMCLRFYNKIHAVRGNEEEKVSFIFAFQKLEEIYIYKTLSSKITIDHKATSLLSTII